MADYTAFVKRVVRLVQTYLSVKNVELEMRPFTDDDEALDVRGEPLTSTTSSAPPSAAVDDDKDDVQLTSRVDNEDAIVDKQTKTRKKRRSSRKSEATGEGLAMEQVDEGFQSFKLCKVTSTVFLFTYLLTYLFNQLFAIYFLAFLFVWWFVWLIVRLFLCLPIHLSVCLSVCLSVFSVAFVLFMIRQQTEPSCVAVLHVVFTGDSDDLMTRQTYNASPPPPPSIPVIADDVTNDVQVTSPVDDVDAELATTQKKTRKKRRSSRKSEDTGEEATSQQVDKGCGKRVS